MNMVSELELLVPELLMTDLIDDAGFSQILNQQRFFSAPATDRVKSKQVLYKQKAMDFFCEQFLGVPDLFKMRNEPIIFRTDHRSRTNVANLPLTLCYFECLLHEGALALTKYSNPDPPSSSSSKNWHSPKTCPRSRSSSRKAFLWRAKTSISPSAAFSTRRGL